MTVKQIMKIIMRFKTEEPEKTRQANKKLSTERDECMKKSKKAFCSILLIVAVICISFKTYEVKDKVDSIHEEAGTELQVKTYEYTPAMYYANPNTPMKTVYPDDSVAISTLNECFSLLSKFLFYDVTYSKNYFTSEAKDVYFITDIMRLPYYTGIDSAKDRYLYNDSIDYQVDELFIPGDLSEYSDITKDTSNGETVLIEYHVTKYSSKSTDTAKQTVEKCKGLVIGVTGNSNQEKMSCIVDILRNDVGIRKEDVYFAGQTEYYWKDDNDVPSYVVDIMARYLGIPCGVVTDINYDTGTGHDWNIFVGSDGQVYEMCATCKAYPALMGSLANHGKFNEKERELALLEFDRKLLEYYGFTNLPLLSDTANPTSTALGQTNTEEVKQGLNFTLTSNKKGTMTVTVNDQQCKYNVRYKRNNSKWMSYTTSKTKYTSKGLRSGKTYTVQVRTLKNGKYGEWSPEMQITIK